MQGLVKNIYFHLRRGGFGRVYAAYWERHLKYSWKRFFPGAKSEAIDRPVFLLGVQGGGLTMIARMLARNPKVMTATGDRRYWFAREELAYQYYRQIPESMTPYFYFLDQYRALCPDILNPRNPVLSDVELARLPDHIRHLRKIYGCYAWWNYASDALLPYFRKTEQNYDEDEAQAFKTILRKLIFIGRPFFSRQQYRFIDKSQIFSVKVGLLNKMFEQEKPIFIAVVRNPYAICWRAATQGYLSSMDSDLEQRVKICSQHWHNTFACIQKDFECIPEARRLVIRIEDVVQDPEEFLKIICKKVELEFSLDMLPQPKHAIPGYAGDYNKWFPVRQEINSKYLSALPGKAAVIIEEKCGDLAREFGYRLECVR